MKLSQLISGSVKVINRDDLGPLMTGGAEAMAGTAITASSSGSEGFLAALV